MGMMTAYDHPRGGRVRVVAPAIRMSETPPEISRPAPLIGQHGREILAEYGVPEDEIAALEAAGDMSVQEP